MAGLWINQGLAETGPLPSGAMSSFRVDAEQVAAIGGRLIDLADALAAQGNGSVDAWAFGPGRAAGAFEELVGSWQHERIRTCGALVELGEAATAAGGLYVQAESVTGRSLIGGDR